MQRFYSGLEKQRPTLGVIRYVLFYQLVGISFLFFYFFMYGIEKISVYRA